MAGNPFDQFDAKSAANPFDQFDAPAKTSAPAAPSGQSAQPGWTDYLMQHLAGDTSLNPNAPNKPLAQTAFWNKPADVSWGDYAQAHLQPLDDTVRAAANTFGGDRFAGMMSNLTGVGGGDLAAQRAQSAAAAQRDPSATAQGNVLGAVMPGGVLGEAAQGGRAIGEAAGLPWWLASPLAGGTVGGGATAGGEALRGEPLSPRDIAIGTVAGGIVGAPAPGRGGALAAPVSEDALRASAKTEYAPLDEYVFHGPSQIKPALDSVTNTMTQAEQDLAASTMAKVNKLAKTNLATGSDIQSYQKTFGELSKSPVKADREYAPQFKKALETVMQGDPYGLNLTPGKGMSLMPPGSLGGTGLTTGGAAAARDAGDIPFGRAEDVNRLDNPTTGWRAQARVKGGPDVGDQISSWLRTGEGQRYAPQPAPGAPPNAFTAYNTVAGTAAKPDTIPWYVKHFMIAPALGIGTTEAINAATGQEHQSPMARIGEDLTVGGGLALGTLGYRGLTSRLNRLEQQRAIDALRSTISTGNYQAPVLPATPLRDWVRQFIYSQGAANRLPGQ